MKSLATYAAALITGIILIIPAFISCDKGNLPPVAKLVAFPAAGDTTVLFDFTAEGSTDDRNYPIGLVFRWDFDGDGVWDESIEPTLPGWATTASGPPAFFRDRYVLYPSCETGVGKSWMPKTTWNQVF